MKNLASHTALVLGLGDSGLAMARWLARCGAQVRMWDSREAPPQAAALAEALPGVTLSHADLRSDEACEQALRGVSLVLKSPGLAPRDERIAALLGKARDRGLPIQGELDLFAQALADLKESMGYTPKVLAITGTNGKTTTTSLTALLVQRCGKRVGLAGNIGPTLLDTLAAALDVEAKAGEAPPAELEESPREGVEFTTAATSGEAVSPASANAHAFSHLPEVWVLELSSFQLHEVHGFEPDAAVVLNLSEDHLDWHGSMSDYAADKARIYGERGVMVINRDDPVVLSMAPMAKPLATDAAARSSPRHKPAPQRPVVHFSLAAPQRVGDYGWVVENGMAWLVRAVPAEDTTGMKKSELPAEAEFILQRLMPADALRIRGRHNAANALAALALATSIGLPLAPMLHGLRDYAGEPHRVQPVARIHEVDFIDDSKGTNVGATVAAIVGLAQDRSPAKLVLILGGDGKGQDFSPLREHVAQHARAVALIGKDAAEIARVLSGLTMPIERFDTLQAATRWAAASAQNFDAVLLSPACASLDMFRNYAHRAEVFTAEVRAMASDAGGMA